ncbi:unnamed protein product [Urochloa humidicola]
MKNRIAATAFLLLLLTLGDEALGNCNEAACSLSCVRAGYKNGGRCVGFAYEFCKCNPNKKVEATLGLEQNKVVTTVEVKPHHRKMLASGRMSYSDVHGDGLDLES